jgi:hypothetical protein
LVERVGHLATMQRWSALVVEVVWAMICR